MNYGTVKNLLLQTLISSWSLHTCATVPLVDVTDTTVVSFIVDTADTTVVCRPQVDYTHDRRVRSMSHDRPLSNFVNSSAI